MITKDTALNLFLVYLLIFVSGSMLFLQAANKYLLISFALVSVAWLLYSDRKISDRFVLFLSIFSGFLLIISLYTDGSLSLMSVLGSTLKLILAYMVLKIVGRDFIDTFVTVVVILAAFSVFGYLTDTFSVLDGVIRKLPRVGNFGYEGLLYLYRSKEHLDRNNSIFFEPGAYQIFLNISLFMLFFAKTKFSRKRYIIYLIVLLTALLTTFSTTGYMIFSIVFAMFLLKSEKMTVRGKLTLVGVLACVVIIFAAQFHAVIFYKIETYLAIEDLTDSSHRRSFDALVDMTIFKQHIFGLGYDKYFAEFGAIGQMREGHTSSNGITKTLAIYGLPFTFFLFSSYLWAVVKLVGPGILSLGVFTVLGIFLFSEAHYVFSPLCFTLLAAVFIHGSLMQKEQIEASRGYAN